MPEVNSNKEKVIAEIGMLTFKNVYKSYLNEPQITALQRQQLQLALDIADEHSPFSSVQLIKDSEGNQFITFIDPKLSE